MMNKRLVRILAIILVILLAGGAVVGALFSAFAFAEDAPGLPLSAQQMTVEYLEEEQALHISQRLDYVNRTGAALEAVVFYAAGNMFRRQDALMYEDDDLAAVFPNGFNPGGVDLRDVRFNGAPADYGFQGNDEIFLRVACQVPPGGSGRFEFEYYLLLTDCNAFMGVGATDVRAGAFYFAPGVFDEYRGEFVMKRPIAHARWMYCEAADFDVTLTLPDQWLPAAVGVPEKLDSAEGRTRWRFRADGVREFSLCFSKRWREASRETGGVDIHAFASPRGGGKRLADAAAGAVAHCEDWLGAFPLERLDVVQSEYPLGALNYPGLIWVPAELLQPGREAGLDMAVRFCVAQQYIGLSACPEPSADAWLSDSVCEYLAYLMLEADDGHDAFLKAVNRDWVSALQLTVPGGLNIASDAALFTADEYGIVVLTRGAVAMHELREAMGPDDLLKGFAEFYRMGGTERTLTEMDFVAALNQASGGDWEKYLTDLVFNIGEYVNQTIDWFE